MSKLGDYYKDKKDEDIRNRAADELNGGNKTSKMGAYVSQSYQGRLTSDSMAERVQREKEDRKKREAAGFYSKNRNYLSDYEEWTKGIDDYLKKWDTGYQGLFNGYHSVDEADAFGSGIEEERQSYLQKAKEYQDFYTENKQYFENDVAGAMQQFIDVLNKQESYLNGAKEYLGQYADEYDYDSNQRIENMETDRTLKDIQKDISAGFDYRDDPNYYNRILDEFNALYEKYSVKPDFTSITGYDLKKRSKTSDYDDIYASHLTATMPGTEYVQPFYNEGGIDELNDLAEELYATGEFESKGEARDALVAMYNYEWVKGRENNDFVAYTGAIGLANEAFNTRTSAKNIGRRNYMNELYAEQEAAARNLTSRYESELKNAGWKRDEGNEGTLSIVQRHWDVISDEERQVISYLSETGQFEKAEDYNGQMERVWTKREADKRKKEISEWTSANAFNAVIGNVGTLVDKYLKPVSWLGQVVQYISEGSADPNAGYNVFSDYYTTVRNTTAQEIKKGTGSDIAAEGYMLGMSMADSALDMALTYGLSSAGIPFAIAENVTLGMMATGVAADTYIEKKEKGYSDGDAQAYGTIAGLAEFVTERISLEQILSPDFMKDGWVKFVVKSGFSEASEEVASNIINDVFDVVYMGDKSEWNQAISEYMREGLDYSEAFARAIADKAVEYAKSGVGGLLSGGLMAGGRTTFNSINNYQKGGEVLKGDYGTEYSDLIDAGLAYGEDTGAHRIAEKLNGETGKRSRLKTGELVSAIEYEQAQEKAGEDILRQAAEELTKKGRIKRSTAKELLDNDYAQEELNITRTNSPDVKTAVERYSEDMRSAAESMARDELYNSLGIKKENVGKGIKAYNPEALARGVNVPESLRMTNDEAYLKYKNAQDNYVDRKKKEPVPGTETIVNTDPSEHTKAEQEVIDEYVDSVDPGVVEFYENTLAGKGTGNGVYKVSEVTGELADKLYDLTGEDFSGYVNEVNESAVRHIEKKHGPNGTSDHSLSNVEDVGRIRYILDNPDNVEYAMKGDKIDTTASYSGSDGKPAPIVLISKKVNGTFYVAETAAENKSRKLHILSARMTKKVGTAQAASAADQTASSLLRPKSLPETMVPTPRTISQNITGRNYKFAISEQNALLNSLPAAEAGYVKDAFDLVDMVGPDMGKRYADTFKGIVADRIKQGSSLSVDNLSSLFAAYGSYYDAGKQDMDPGNVQEVNPKQPVNHLLTVEEKKAAWLAGNRDAAEAKGEITNEQSERNDGVRKSGKWTDGENTGKQTRSVGEGSGEKTPGRSEQQLDERNAGKDLKANGKEISAVEFGLKNGTDKTKVRLWVDALRTDMKDAKELAAKHGLKTVFFYGNNLSTGTKEGNVRGFIKGNTIYIRADHPNFSPEQIAKHEIFHNIVADKNEKTHQLNVERLWNDLRRSIGKENLSELLDHYKEAYWEDDVREKADEETLSEMEQKLQEEILADMYGGMNTFRTASRFAAYWDTVDGILDSAQLFRDYAESEAEEKIKARNRENEVAEQFSEEIVPYSQKEKEFWSNSKKIVVYDGTAEQIVDFVKKALSDGLFKRKLYFGKISGVLADRIQRETGISALGKNITLYADNIRKVQKDHGNADSESKRGQRAVVSSDYAKIPEIIVNAQKLIAGTYEKTGKPSVTFEWREKNERYNLVLVDNGQSMDIFVQTFYINTKKGSIARLDDAQGAKQTSKTTSGTASTDNIKQQASKSQAEFFKMSSEIVEDSEGNRLSKDQEDFFKDSKILDEDGRLQVVYHGTDQEFTVFDRAKGRSTMDIQGSFFSPWEIDAQGYGSNVQAYYLNIKNPASEGTAYKALNLFKGQNEAGRKAREYLESLGYDGVNNSNEEYIAFYPEQIKLTSNATPTSDPDVRFSEEIEEKGLKKASNVPEAQFTDGVPEYNKGATTEEQKDFLRNYSGRVTIGGSKKIRVPKSELAIISTSVKQGFALLNSGATYGSIDTANNTYRFRVAGEDIVITARRRIPEYSDTVERVRHEEYRGTDSKDSSQNKGTENDGRRVRDASEGSNRGRLEYDGRMAGQASGGNEGRGVRSNLEDNGRSLGRLNNEQNGIQKAGDENSRFFDAKTSEELSDFAGEPATLMEAKRMLSKIQRENERLKERNEYLEGQMKSTVAHMDPKSVQRWTKKIVKEYGTDIDSEKVAAALTEAGRIYIEEYGKTETPELELKIRDALRPAAEEIILHAKKKVAVDTAGYKSLQSVLKAGIKLSDQDKSNIADLNYWMKANYGYVTLTDKGQPMDSLYMELQDEFGRDLFPDEIMNPADQLVRAVEVLKDLKGVYENPFQSFEMAEALTGVTDDLMTSLYNGMIRQADPTFADKMEAKLAEERANTARKIEEAVAENQKKNDRVIAELKREYRENTKQMVRAQRLQDMSERDRISKNEKLRRLIRRLRNRKLSAVNRARIDEIIGELDTEYIRLTGDKLEELQSLDDFIRDNDDVIFPEHTKKAVASLRKKHIGELTQEEVANLTEVLLSIETEIANANKQIDTEDKRETFRQAFSVMNDIRNTRGTHPGFVRELHSALVLNTLSPERFGRTITGYVEGDPLQNAFYDLTKGETKMIDHQMKAYGLFDKWTNDKTLMRKWQGRHADVITINGQGRNGSYIDVEITPAMRISLYMHSLNDDNMRHIQYGGVKIPDMKLYKAGKFADAYSAGITIKLTRADIRKIARGMSNEELAFVHAVQDYFQGMSKDSINEVAEKLLGYDIAGEENYYPIYTDSNFIKTNFDGMKFDGTIEGMGFLKERINSVLPIYLQDATKVMKRSIDSTARYVGLAIPVRNVNKLLGVSSGEFIEQGRYQGDITVYAANDSILASIDSKYGKPGIEYVRQLMRNIQTGSHEMSPYEQFFRKLRSNYAGAVLTLNAGVAMKQAASYPTAAAVLGAKPLLRAMRFDQFGKVDLENIAKYTPVQWYRSRGFTTQELGDIKASGVNIPSWLNWIQAIDLLTTRKLWKASEFYVQDHNPELKKGTEEYYDEVGKIYNKVIWDTQPNYTTMQRPGNLRSDNFLVQTLMMFKTQPFQNFNILYDAVGNFKAKRNGFFAAKNSDDAEALKKAEANYKEAGRNVRRAIGSQVVSLIVFAGMTALWSFLQGKKDKYKDKDGDENVLTWLAGIGKDALAGAAGMIPFGSDVWDVMSSLIFKDRYYGYSSVADSALKDLLDTIQSTASAITEGKMTPAKWKKLIKNTAQTLGIPAKNVANLINGILQWFGVDAGL